VPTDFLQKVGVLKYREDSRAGSTGTGSVAAPDTGAHSECEDGDDFDDAMDAQADSTRPLLSYPKRSQGDLDKVKARLMNLKVFDTKEEEVEDDSMVIAE